MITSRPTSTQNTVKSLSASLPTEEAKTPEIETVVQSESVVKSNNKETTENEQEREEKGNDEFESSQLSERAQKVKESLRRKCVVKAVILVADGTSQQIDYNASSKETNLLLNGRPTIIGELEDLNVIVVRSLNGRHDALNKHILPVPFCNKEYRGNYLLYRIDSKGDPIDLSLSRYEQYVVDNKKQTDDARKNFDPIDNCEIKTSSSFNSNSRLTLVYLRSAVDKQIRARDKYPTESEIEDSVNESLQRLVNELVNESNDSDYYINDCQETIDTECDWRLQLKDALKYVRERGRFDGRVLAEKISFTFYELNGAEATLDELTDVFTRIKAELADEALQDLSDNEYDYFLERDPSDIVETSFRIVSQSLLDRAKSSFIICKRREPTNDELADSVAKLALKLADDAIDNFVESSNIANDPDYDPNNAFDTKLAEIDLFEDEEWNENNFNYEMLLTEPIKSSLGVSTAYNVYFCKLNGKRERNSLLAAIKSFKMRNNRDPTQLEINGLKEFIFINNDSFKKQRLVPTTTPSSVLVTPVKKKKSAARYNVYFTDDNADQEKNERLAIKWFKRFNNRSPTQLELAGIEQFIKSDKTQLTEVEYNVPIEVNDDDDIKQTEQEKVKTHFVVEKKLSTKYTLNFDDKEERENGDEKQAVKWFKRFNNRDPTQPEQEKIKQFIKTDNSDTIDID